MIHGQAVCDDPLSDFAGAIIRRLRRRKSWAAPQTQDRDLLINVLERSGYRAFTASAASFGLSRVGQSCLYDVPPEKRGHLETFRGKKIRVVCVGMGGGAFKRSYMAGVIRVL